MIDTVTFNPSLDYIVHINDLNLGAVNRTQKEELYPGGKAVNVAIMLKNLGLEATALGFIAGFSGKEIERLLQRSGCKTDFIPVEHGFSRINVKIKAQQETEINGQGPELSEEHLKKLYAKLDRLTAEDLLVLSGSIPSTLPSDIYEQILSRMEGKEIKVVVDATGNLLLNVLKYRPFLIKPNHYELGDLFGKKLRSKDDIIHGAKELQNLGARNVLVSMAGDGAILLDETGQIHHRLPPNGTVINSVGAGDSMVAGFLAGWVETGCYEEAFKMGLCAGSASAFSQWLATKDAVMHLYNQIQ